MRTAVPHLPARRRSEAPLRARAMDYVALGVRFVLASMFLFAGLAKLRQMREFERAVQGYDLLPPRIGHYFAQVLPGLEVGGSILLVLGVAIPAVAGVFGLLLCSFAVAIAVNLARGRQIDCGCFSTVAARRITHGLVARNVALAACAGFLAWDWPRELSLDGALAGGAPFGARDALAVAFASVSGTVVLTLASEMNRYRRAAMSLLDE